MGSRSATTSLAPPQGNRWTARDVLSMRKGYQNGFQGGWYDDGWTAKARSRPQARHSPMLTAGPAAVVRNLARGVCGTSTLASPPSGQMRISVASPLTQ